MTKRTGEPIWLTSAQVKSLHAASMELFGGRIGLRDEGLLESAVAKPVQRYHYGDNPSLFRLAAAYGFGLARNHPFTDGNKRAAALAVRAFLFRNGYTFSPPVDELVLMFERLAEGVVDEPVLSEWIEANSRRLDQG